MNASREKKGETKNVQTPTLHFSYNPVDKKDERDITSSFVFSTMSLRGGRSPRYHPEFPYRGEAISSSCWGLLRAKCKSALATTDKF